MNRPKRPLTSLLLLGVMSTLTLGCGTDTHTSQSVYNYISIDTANGYEFTINEVEFTIDGPLKFEHKYRSSTGTETFVETTIAGWPIKMVGENLHVGTQVFEHVHRKDKVNLSASGVSVNGKRRGDFPNQTSPSK